MCETPGRGGAKEGGVSGGAKDGKDVKDVKDVGRERKAGVGGVEAESEAEAEYAARMAVHLRMIRRPDAPQGSAPSCP